MIVLVTMIALNDAGEPMAGAEWAKVPVTHEAWSNTPQEPLTAIARQVTRTIRAGMQWEKKP